MPDPRIAKLARLIVEYSVKIRPGDQVFVTTSQVALPLVQELYKLILQRGGHLTPVVELPGMLPILFENASDEQLSAVPAVMQMVMDTFDVRLSIASSVNTRELTGVDPARMAKRNQAMRPILQKLMERSGDGSLRWNVCMFPTDAYAQDAEMSLAEFEDFVYGACLCNEPDPIAAWQEVARKQQQLVDWLNGKHEIHVVGPDTDLHVGVAGRTWVNCLGDKNMPDGEVFTGPVESQIDGSVCFSFPAIYQGREVSDVRLWFENGEVVKWSAAKGEEFLGRMLHTDEGARWVGEFAFGTNFGIQRFIKNMLFDEKIGGTIHMAMGAGYPETGSKSQSAIHWDMLCDLRQGGEVTVDGELFMKDGKYLLWKEDGD